MNAYINEETISISDLILAIGEDLTTYDGNMDQIERHNTNISVLKKTESILTELFGGTGASGSVGSSKKGKKGKKGKKDKKSSMW